MKDRTTEKLWALSLVIVGFFLMLSMKVSITGAVVGISQFSFVSGTFASFVLVLVGLIWFSRLNY